MLDIGQPLIVRISPASSEHRVARIHVAVFQAHVITPLLTHHLKIRLLSTKLVTIQTLRHDWIELRNVSDAEQNINNWRLTHAHAGTDAMPRQETAIITFPEIKIPAGEVLLIVAAAPADTDLAEGFDIEIDEANQKRGYGPHKYKILSGLNIPEITDGFLILRSKHEDKYLKGRGHLHDAVGPLRVTHNTVLDLTTDDKEPESGNMFWKTDAWPINGHSGNDYRAHNADGSNNNNASA